MSADQKFKLQNGNGGLQNHNYYQRKMYEDKFREIKTRKEAPLRGLLFFLTV